MDKNIFGRINVKNFISVLIVLVVVGLVLYYFNVFNFNKQDAPKPLTAEQIMAQLNSLQASQVGEPKMSQQEIEKQLNVLDSVPNTGNTLSADDIIKQLDALSANKN